MNYWNIKVAAMVENILFSYGTKYLSLLGINNLFCATLKTLTLFLSKNLQNGYSTQN